LRKGGIPRTLAAEVSVSGDGGRYIDSLQPVIPSEVEGPASLPTPSLMSGVPSLRFFTRAGTPTAYKEFSIFLLGRMEGPILPHKTRKDGAPAHT
jgi:hypothetical protein